MLLKINGKNFPVICDCKIWSFVNGIPLDIFFGEVDGTNGEVFVEIRSHIKEFKEFSGAVKATKKYKKITADKFVHGKTELTRSTVLSSDIIPAALFKEYRGFIELGIDPKTMEDSYWYFENDASWVVNLVKLYVCRIAEEMTDTENTFAIVKNGTIIFCKNGDWYSIDTSVQITNTDNANVYEREVVGSVKPKSIDPLEGYDDGLTMIYVEYKIGDIEDVMWETASDVLSIEAPAGVYSSNYSRPIIVARGHWRHYQDGKRIWVKMHSKRKRMAARYYIHPEE